MEFEAPVFDQHRLNDPDDVEPDQDQVALAKFFTEIDKLGKHFATVDTAIAQLKASSDQITKTFMEDNSAEQTSASARIAGSKALTEISNRLKELNEQVKQETDKEEKANADDPEKKGRYSAELRQKRDVLHATTKKFHSYSSQFQSCQASAKAVQEQKVKRIIRSMRSDLQDAQIDLAMEGGSAAIQNMLQMNQDDTQQILNDVVERNEMVKEIQRTAQEIHQLTMDAAVMCEQQSKMIERIEANVLQARSDVQEGTVNLENADKILKKSNKCLCCTIVFSVLGAAVLIFIISGVIKAKK